MIEVSLAFQTRGLLTAIRLTLHFSRESPSPTWLPIGCTMRANRLAPTIGVSPHVIF
jgi:hypothetical protein